MYFTPNDPPHNEIFHIDKAAYAALFSSLYYINSGNGMSWGNPLQITYGNGITHVFYLKP